MMPRFPKPVMLATAVVAVAWAVFACCGNQVAGVLASRFERILQRVANGKFEDPVVFVHGRMMECLILLAVAVALWLLGWVVFRHPRMRSLPPMVAGLGLGLWGFCCLNVLAWVAGQTVVFWSLFYDKAQVDNFAQYQIKNTLIREIHGKHRVILIGNSQTNRSIDEVAMNKAGGGKLWATELSQPGAKGFDLLTLTRQMHIGQGDVVVCYLSEIYFYGGGSGAVAAEFFSFRELPDVFALRGWDLFPDGAIASGLLGRVLPLYRFRNSLAHRLLGWQLTSLKQREFDQSLEEDLEAQANRRGGQLQEGRSSAFEQAAFSRMVAEVAGKGASLVLIAGHNHPALQRHMNPALRADLTGFLARLESNHPGRVTVIDGGKFFQPVEADFADLVHFTDPAQQRFTAALTGYLVTKHCK